MLRVGVGRIRPEETLFPTVTVPFLPGPILSLPGYFIVSPSPLSPAADFDTSGAVFSIFSPCAYPGNAPPVIPH